MEQLKAKGYLSGFVPLTTGRVYSQAANTDWLLSKTWALPFAAGVDARAKERAALLMARLQDTGAVAARASCLPDADPDLDAAPAASGSGDARRDRLFREVAGAAWWRPTLERRMQLFALRSLDCAREAFSVDEAAPGQIIQVSCTGYASPNAAQRVVAERAWSASTRVLHLGHMGCYAAVPAITTAASTAQAFAGRTAVLHVELCTLHVRLEDQSADQIVIRYLFADGAMRYDVTAEPAAGPRLALLDSFEVLLPDSAEAMTWVLADGGFRMTLARRVPASVAQALPHVVQEFLAKHGLYRGDIARYAVHPGGTRVLDSVAASLELNADQLRHSYGILRTRGNMSSATLPYIFASMLGDQRVGSGELILALAFGPGLTITGLLLRRDG